MAAQDLAWWRRRFAHLEDLYTNGAIESIFEGRELKFRNLADVRTAMDYAAGKVAELEGAPAGLPRSVRIIMDETL